MKAIDRVFQYIDNKGIKPSKFEQFNELSNGYLGTQRRRKADLGESVMNKILNNCLSINPTWLLTGKGEMLLKEKNNQVSEPKDTPISPNNIVSYVLDYLINTLNIGDITPMKLQKLLYYIEGYHLAITGQSFLDMDILKWRYGPVVLAVYHEYKSFGSNIVGVPSPEEERELTDEQIYILNTVGLFYGRLSGIVLSHLTHEEKPYQDAARINAVIDKDLMCDFFKKMVDENGKINPIMRIDSSWVRFEKLSDSEYQKIITTIPPKKKKT